MATDVKSQEKVEEREDNSFSENGMRCAEGVMGAHTFTHSHVNTDICLTSFHYALYISSANFTNRAFFCVALFHFNEFVSSLASVNMKIHWREVFICSD